MHLLGRLYLIEPELFVRTQRFRDWTEAEGGPVGSFRSRLIS
jgi:hypothetical protein